MGWAAELIDCAVGSRALGVLLRRQTERQPATFPMRPDSMAVPEGDSRRHPRANVALAAEIHHNSQCVSATICNISRCGAMLKAFPLPGPGAAVHVVRGGMASQATVIWSAGNRCGLGFPKEIEVGEWVLPLRNVGQRRIDQLVALIKSGQAAPNAVPSPSSALPQQRAHSQLMDDVNIVVELLRDLMDELTSSLDTVGRHGENLQRLDAAIQMLSGEQLHWRSGPQLVEGLGEPFELLVCVEDEITCCDETLARHSYKLQHLDLAMQMLEEIVSGLLISDAAQTLSPSRLLRLRTACELALESK